MKTYRYPGINPFSIDEKDIFFGRTDEKEKLYNQICVDQLIVLFSKSGLGKSSLINAGIIPLIKERESFQPYHVKFSGYNKDSKITLLEYIKKGIIADNDVETLLSKFEIDQKSIWHILKSNQLLSGKNDFLLIFDQFENLFTFPLEEIKKFKEELSELINVRVPENYLQKLEEEYAKNNEILTENEINQLYEPLNVKILIAIRSSKISLMNSLKDKLPSILNKTFELAPLNPEQARNAIVKPAKLEGDAFESPQFEITKSALDKIFLFLNREGDDEIESFQLQVICRYIEDKVIGSNKKVITDTDLGEISIVFKNLYDDFIDTIENEEEKKKVRILVEEGLIFEEDKRRLSVYEGRIKTQFGISDKLLDKLVKSRIIRGDRHPLGGNSYELSHDSLVEPILESRKKREKEEEKEKAYLLMLKDRKDEENRVQNERKKLKQRFTKRLGLATGIASILLLCLVLLMYFSWRQSKDFSSALSIKSDSLKIVTDSLRIKSESLKIKSDSLIGKTKSYLKQKDLANSLANIAGQQRDSALIKNDELARMSGQLKLKADTLTKIKDTLQWKTEIIEYLMKEGFWLHNLDKELRTEIVDALTEKKISDKEHQTLINYVELAALGKVEVERDYISALEIAKKVYNESDHEIVKKIIGTYCRNLCFPELKIDPIENISSFDISKDGQKIVFIKKLSPNIFILNPRAGGEIDSIITNFNKRIKSIQTIPNTDSILVIEAYSGSAMIYDFSGNFIHEIKVTKKNDYNYIEEVILSIDSDLVYFYISDGRLDIYNLKTQEHSIEDLGLPYLPVFRHTSNYLFMLDNEVLYWINLNDFSSNSLKVNSDNKLLLITSDMYAITTKDNILYVTDLESESIINASNQAEQTSFSGDDKSYRLSGHTSSISTIALTNDFFASGSVDKTIRIWKYHINENRATLVGHESPIVQLKFIPFESRIISLSQNGTFIIWDFNQVLNSHENIFSSADIRIANLSAISDKYFWLNKYDYSNEFNRLAIELPRKLYYESNLEDCYFYYEKGYKYFQLQDTVRAKDAFYKSYIMNPNYSHALNGVGYMFYLESNYDSALFFLNRAIVEDPTLLYAYSNRANVYFDIEEYNLAFSDYNVINNIDTAFIYGNSWLLLGEKLQFKKEYSKAIKCYINSFKQSTYYIQALDSIGNIYKFSYDPSKSLNAFHSLLIHYPESPLVLEKLTTLQFNLGNYDSAVYYQERYTNLDQEYYLGWWNLGWYRIFVKDYNGSIEASTRAWKIDKENNGNNIMILINKAHAYLLSKEFEEAKNIYLMYKDYPWEGKLMKEAIVQDFNTLRNAGIIEEDIEVDMKRIIQLLFP